MKNLKLTSFLILLTLIVATISPVFAADPIKSSIKDLEIDITNFEEPILNAKPSFDYNVEFGGIYSDEVNAFDFVEWLEFDEDYDFVYDYIENNIYTYSNLWMLYENASKGIYNSNSYANENHPPISKMNHFTKSKTYAAIFYGNFYNEIKLGLEDLNSSATLLDNSSPTLLTSSNRSSPVYATVNGKDENVFTVVDSKDKVFYRSNLNGMTDFPDFNRFAVIALYEPTVQKQDYKATVNWINAEGKIPESFILKLMNGSNVVKEQVITKDNAVDEDTWEYDFGEYPTLDDNGNEITYTLAYSEGKDGDLKFFESNQDGFVINNTYIAPEISSKVKMRSLADREKNNVKYRIDYNASIKKYSGNADVVLTTTLPFAIDEAKSDLDDGTYDAKTKTITWNYTIENIDKMYDYSTTKNIDLYATAVLPYAIEAKTVGEIALTDAEGFSESVDAIDNIEAGTGNPKTGDINLQKYLSIGLIGIVAILMVVSIRRKYSTRKSKVQF